MKLLFIGHFYINATNKIGAGIECRVRRYILQETSSHHPCPCYYLFSFPSAFKGYQLSWFSYSPWVGGVLVVHLPFLAWIGQINPRLVILDPWTHTVSMCDVSFNVFFLNFLIFNYSSVGVAVINIE